jgi:hypothetical protein
MVVRIYFYLGIGVKDLPCWVAELAIKLSSKATVTIFDETAQGLSDLSFRMLSINRSRFLVGESVNILRVLESCYSGWSLFLDAGKEISSAVLESLLDELENTNSNFVSVFYGSGVAYSHQISRGDDLSKIKPEILYSAVHAPFAVRNIEFKDMSMLYRSAGLNTWRANIIFDQFFSNNSVLLKGIPLGNMNDLLTVCRTPNCELIADFVRGYQFIEKVWDENTLSLVTAYCRVVEKFLIEYFFANLNWESKEESLDGADRFHRQEILNHIRLTPFRNGFILWCRIVFGANTKIFDITRSYFEIRKRR